MARKSKKKDFPWSMLIAAAVTFAAGVVFMVYFGKDYLPSTTPDKGTPSAPAKPSYQVVRLYFTGEDGRYLSSEKRTIKTGKLTDRLNETLKELMDGPDGALYSPIPEGTRLLSVKVKRRTAYVDLSGEFASNHPGGSSWELHSIYSVVNTVGLNFQDVDSVQLLIDGKRADTLAGHVVIRIPLVPDEKLVKGR